MCQKAKNSVRLIVMSALCNLCGIYRPLLTAVASRARRVHPQPLVADAGEPKHVIVHDEAARGAGGARGGRAGR